MCVIRAIRGCYLLESLALDNSRQPYGYAAILRVRRLAVCVPTIQ